MNITRENYRDFKAVNNGALSYFLPECGGSKKKFMWYMGNNYPPIKQTDEVLKGTIMHSWHEAPSTFKMTVIENKPSEVIRAMVDAAVAAEAAGENSNDAVLATARQLNYGKGSYNDLRILDDVADKGKNYYQALQKAAGGFIVSSENETNILGMQSSIRENAPELVDDSLIDPKIRVHKELALSFMINGVPCKCLIDRLVVCDEENWYRVEELKCTTVPVHQYLNPWWETIEQHNEDGTIKLSPQYRQSIAQIRNVPRQLAFYSLGVRLSGMLSGNYIAREPVIHGIEMIPPYEYGHTIGCHREMAVHLKNRIKQSMTEINLIFEENAL